MAERAPADSPPGGSATEQMRSFLRGRRAAVALATLVAVAFVGYGALSYYVQVPRVFGDEVIYLDAADSLADGHGLHVDGASYGRGAAYPAAVAPLLVASQNRSDMYLWIKVLNALAFSLAAVPIYLIARRLLPRAYSVAVATLALVIPSSAYVGLVMTESLAYLASSLVLYAIVRAVEDPTRRHQVLALATIAVAYLVRPQFAAFYVVYLLAIAAAAWFVAPGRRRDRLRSLWPSWAFAVLAAVAVVAVAFTAGSSSLGSYSGLWRTYSVSGVARWFEYDLTDLGLYLGLLPFALFPSIALGLYRRARSGAANAAATLCVLVFATFVTVLVAAAFDSTPAGLGQLHDRYFFYVVPLWLVAGAAWIHEGAPRSRASMLVGAVVLLAIVAAFPADARIVDDAAKELHATGTPLWVTVRNLATAHGQTAHRALFLCAILAAALAWLVPRRRAVLLAVPVAAVFLANGAFLWTHDIRDNSDNVFAGGDARGWIDRNVPAGQDVTMLDLSPPRCGPSLPYAYALTQFFNDRVTTLSSLGRQASNGVPAQTVRVRSNGDVVHQSSGRPLDAEWLVVPSGVEVDGQPRAEGTTERLVLWRTDGTVVVHADSNAQLASQACAPTS